jgi:hypothetical protein
MRYLMTIRADKNTKAGLPPDPRLMAKVAEMGAKMTKEGKMIATGGLGWSLPSTRISVGADGLTVTDGPFPETKELIAGFALFEFASREEALEQGRRFMEMHREVMGPDYEGTMEIHDVFGG